MLGPCGLLHGNNAMLCYSSWAVYHLGEVGGMPKLGQSRKSRLRRHGKEWKKSVHGDLKL